MKHMLTISGRIDDPESLLVLGEAILENDAPVRNGSGFSTVEDAIAYLREASSSSELIAFCDKDGSTPELFGVMSACEEIGLSYVFTDLSNGARTTSYDGASRTRAEFVGGDVNDLGILEADLREIATCEPSIARDRMVQALDAMATARRLSSASLHVEVSPDPALSGR